MTDPMDEADITVAIKELSTTEFRDRPYLKEMRGIMHRHEITSAQKRLNQAQGDLVGAVHAAKRDGMTWAEIGDLLGITRQAAQQRFR